jgi:hypothetical protein
LGDIDDGMNLWAARHASVSVSPMKRARLSLIPAYSKI